NAGALDLRFVKPIDKEALKIGAENYERFAVISDSSIVGGVTSAVLETLAALGLCVRTIGFELPDCFLAHGHSEQIEESLMLTAEQIARRLIDDCGN
ncbi:MAG: 1-deoxy-D-xylulose-5-phosphate synthase, partial [Helicobacteraceae bacterium]|nr:1-deoxy-D-xylulose-5-phosphate synthase [Helicobacteraceae bacterium]